MKKILIAEDEVTTSKYWEKELKAKGYDVRARIAGVDARGDIRRWKPDLVVLDLSMPTTGREEGFRVLEYMSKRKLEIPVIIATAMYKREEVERILDKIGCRELVRKIMIKDFSNEELLKKVEEVLHKSV